VNLTALIRSLAGAGLVVLMGAACSVGPPVSAAGGAPASGISPAPSQYVAQTPRPASAQPQQIRIPAIGVAATVEPVGLGPDFSMDVPRVVTDVGWYSLGSVPGQPGDAVIDGHLDGPGGRPLRYPGRRAHHAGHLRRGLGHGKADLHGAVRGRSLALVASGLPNNS
jgi:hypothetical protein